MPEGASTQYSESEFPLKSVKLPGFEAEFRDMKPPMQFVAMVVAAIVLLAFVWTFNFNQYQQFAFALMIVGLLIFSFCTIYWPAFVRQKREREIRQWAVRGRVGRPGYFRLSPYEDVEEDRKNFDRPDGAHTEILQWLVTTNLPIVYLTGQSGCGKSSLLNAFVIPQLRDSHGMEIIRIRSFADATEELRGRLIEFAEARNLYQRIPKWFHEDSVPDILSKVTERWKSSAEDRQDLRILIIFDQFEELIILNELFPARVNAMHSFLKEYLQQELSTVRILLTLRSDYEHLLAKLDLPPIYERNIHRKVGAFTTSQARQLLTAADTNISLGEERLKSVLLEAAIVNDNRGMIRPIVINMLGRVLERYADTSQLPVHSEGRLLSTDVRTTIEQVVGGDSTKKILERMLSDEQSKWPRTIAEIEKETELDAGLIEGSLMKLAESGLVRLVSEAETPGHRVWEISHDFVATIIAGVIREPAPVRLSERVRPVLLPALAAILLIVNQVRLSGNQQILDFVHMGFVLKELDSGGMLARAESGQWNPDTRDYNKGTFQAVSSDEFVDGLKLLDKLRWLDLDGCPTLQTVDLSGFPDLEWVELDDCQALTTVRLHDLPSLRQLTVSGCPNLQRVEGLAKLESLEFYAMTGTRPSQAEGLTSLGRLRSFAWIDSDSLEGLPELENVVEVDLGLPIFPVESTRTATYSAVAALGEKFPGMEYLYTFGLTSDEVTAIRTCLPDEFELKLVEAQKRGYRSFPARYASELVDSLKAP